ncbi:TlpA disulfide reductase family protein [Pikeienuella sp. HZG-20]|uniref:TlpA disulfide reductase family protein n=1 Tax=Paludibacillus litoralis TaxID=3133267 RepID=UPI0030ECC8B2
MKTKVAGFIGAILYGALAFGATPAAATGLSAAEIASLKAARAGDMTKLIIHDAPRARLETPFETGRGAEVRIADFGGKMMVVNFWATWCPPCRKEMPSLDRLRGAMADDGFDLIAISMDRASTEKIKDFFLGITQEDGSDYRVKNLDIYREPTLRIGAEGGILGMPITLILDRNGDEVARLQGEAEWDSPESIAMLKAIRAALDSNES